MLVLSDDKEAVERMRASGRPIIGGDGAAVRGIIEQYIEAGVDEVIIPDFNLGRSVADKTAVMDRFGDEVMSHFK
jgi:hypothetical protein